MVGDILGVAIIGCGHQGSGVHSWAWRKANGAEILAFVDVDEKKAKLAAKKGGVKCWYTDYREALDNDDIDIVDLCLPHHLHAHVSCEAMEAGKHVLVEKPMANSLAEAERMVETAQKEDVKLAVAEFWRYCPMHLKAKEATDKGSLGEVFMIRSEHCNRAREATDREYVMTSKWKINPEKIGFGILHAAACHPISLMTMLGGDVERIFAVKTLRAQPEWLLPQIEVTVLATLKFKNGAIGEMLASAVTYNYAHYSTWILGNHGTIVMDMFSGFYSYSSQLCSSGGNYQFNREPGEEERNGYLMLIQDFADCIKDGREPLTSGRIEKENLKIIFAGYKSIEEGRAVKIDEVYP